MKVNPESFRGKLYLLAIDKIVIGAIIAVAFVAYDRFRTVEVRTLEDKAASVQLTFERARLAKEFLPFITNRKEDVIARGYTLREAVRTGSIDAEAAVEIGRQLLEDGISDDHFRRVMVVVIPDGVPAIARHGVELSVSWRKVDNSPFDPATTFNPVSGRENIPKEFAPLIREGRLWRSVLVEGLSGASSTTCDSLQDTSKLAASLYGLFTLMHPGSQPEAIELSQSPCRDVNLVGHLSRVLFSGRDKEAIRRVSAELSRDHKSLENIRLARVILGILSEFGLPIVGGVSSGPPSGPIAVTIAQILVEPPSPRESQPGVDEAHYWLQWQAADVLDLMTLAAKPTHLEGARSAEPVLVSFLSQFATEVMEARDESRLESLSQKYESGNLVRRVVAILAAFDTQNARTVLSKLRSAGSTKLRHFPFLDEEVERALKK